MKPTKIEGNRSYSKCGKMNNQLTVMQLPSHCNLGVETEQTRPATTAFWLVLIAASNLCNLLYNKI